MKRVIRRKQPIEVLESEWLIEIFPCSTEQIKGATSILDVNSSEYQSFINSMTDMFYLAGYERYDDPKYTHPSNRGDSQSWYYTFIKVEDYVEIRVVVNVRISDHPNHDKRWATARQLRQRYVSRLATDLANEYESTPLPMVRDIEIIFDDEEYCKSYAAAEFKIREQIIELDEAFEDWKQEYLTKE